MKHKSAWQRGEVAALRNRILTGQPLTPRDERLIAINPFVRRAAETAREIYMLAIQCGRSPQPVRRRNTSRTSK